MPAKFKADSTFTIEGRGLVIAGEILEGVITGGMLARIPSWPRPLTVSDVAFIRRIDREPSEVGRVFTSQDEADFIRWRELDLKDQILEIDDGDA